MTSGKSSPLVRSAIRARRQLARHARNAEDSSRGPLAKRFAPLAADRLRAPRFRSPYRGSLFAFERHFEAHGEREGLRAFRSEIGEAHLAVGLHGETVGEKTLRMVPERARCDPIARIRRRLDGIRRPTTDCGSVSATPDDGAVRLLVAAPVAASRLEIEKDQFGRPLTPYDAPFETPTGLLKTHVFGIA